MKKFLKIMLTVLMTTMTMATATSCSGEEVDNGTTATSCSGEEVDNGLLFSGLNAADTLPEDISVNNKKGLIQTSRNKNIIRTAATSVYQTTREQEEWLIVYLTQPEDISIKHEVLRITVKYPNEKTERIWSDAIHEFDNTSRVWWKSSDYSSVYIPITTANDIGSYTYEVTAISYIDYTDNNSIKNVVNINGEYENTIIFAVGYRNVIDITNSSAILGYFSIQYDNTIYISMFSINDYFGYIRNDDNIPLSSIIIYGSTDNITVSSYTLEDVSKNYTIDRRSVVIPADIVLSLNLSTADFMKITMIYSIDDTISEVTGNIFNSRSDRTGLSEMTVRYGWELELITLWKNKQVNDTYGESILFLMFDNDIVVPDTFDGFHANKI